MPSKRPRAPPRVHGAGGEKVPVVIVTGFLGAGKTTLMEHLLANAEGQVIGCVVNDLAAINIDATLVAEAAKKTGAAGGGLHMVTLEDGCICCERSGDLLPCIDELLARKACGPDRRPFDLILVECTGMAEPSQMLASFSRPTSTARHVLEEVYLSSVLAMIDGPAFEAQYDSHARSRIDKHCIVDLLMAQVETADLIVLNKMDGLDEPRADTIYETLAALNPRAAVLRTSYARLPLSAVLGAGREGNGKGSGSPQEKRGRVAPASAPPGTPLGESLPRRLRSAVNSLVFVRDRPFHPERLLELVVGRLPTRRQAGVALRTADERADELARNPLCTVLRSKGFAWLASQPDARFAWAYAGFHFQLREHGSWSAAAEREVVAGSAAAGGGDDAPDTLGASDALESFFTGTQGGAPRGVRAADPQQRLIFIGLGMPLERVEAALDECLLTDREMAYFCAGAVAPPSPVRADDEPVAEEHASAAAVEHEVRVSSPAIAAGSVASPVTSEDDRQPTTPRPTRHDVAPPPLPAAKALDKVCAVPSLALQHSGAAPLIKPVKAP